MSEVERLRFEVVADLRFFVGHTDGTGFLGRRGVANSAGIGARFVHCVGKSGAPAPNVIVLVEELYSGLEHGRYVFLVLSHSITFFLLFVTIWFRLANGQPN